MSDQQFCLRWNDYQGNLMTVFDNLLSSETFVDVTLACDGTSIKAHKMVLSACSSFFKELFHNNPCSHPIVILKDISFANLKAIVEFMYRGEINISQDQLEGILKDADVLKIKGLTGCSENQILEENMDDVEPQIENSMNDNSIKADLKSNKKLNTNEQREYDEECAQPQIKFGYDESKECRTAMSEMPHAEVKSEEINSSHGFCRIKSEVEDHSLDDEVIPLSPPLNEQSKSSFSDQNFELESSCTLQSEVQNDVFEDTHKYGMNQDLILETKTSYQTSQSSSENTNHFPMAQGSSNKEFIESNMSQDDGALDAGLTSSFASMNDFSLQNMQSAGYPCRICGKFLSSRFSSVRHMKRFHLSTQVLMCIICQKIFPSVDNLRSHMGYAHKKRIVIKNKKIIKCYDK